MKKSLLMVALIASLTLTGCNDAPTVDETPMTSNTGAERLEHIKEDAQERYDKWAEQPVQTHVDNMIEGSREFGRKTADAVERVVEYSNESGFTDKFLDNLDRVGDSFRQLPELLQ